MYLFEFPFRVDIWGTVSDWIMVAVTTITAYFLYKTLQSQKEVQQAQKEVQQAQNKLLEIEQLRIKEEFKPIIKCSRHYDNRTDDTSISAVKIVNISDNPALNVKLDFYFDNRLGWRLDKDRVYPHELINNDESSIVIHFKREEVDHIQNVFAIEYQDKIGTKYRQQVVYYKIEKIELFFPIIPELV